MTRLYLSRAFSLSGIIAPLYIVAAIFIAGTLTPGYNHLTDTISVLSSQSSKNPWLMITGFIVYGVLITGFAYALYLKLGRGVLSRTTWGAMTVYGICIILGGIFRDSPGAIKNTEGILHNAVIIISCFAFLIGIIMFVVDVYKNPFRSGFTWFTIAATIMGLILSIIFVPQLRVPMAGLLQRVFYFIILLWIEAVSIWLFRSSFKP